MKNSRGSVFIVFILVALIVLTVVVAGASWYLTQRTLTPTDGKLPESFQVSPPPSMEPISTKNDTSTVESELDATVVGSPDEDFTEVESAASEL